MLEDLVYSLDELFLYFFLGRAWSPAHILSFAILVNAAINGSSVLVIGVPKERAVKRSALGTPYF